MKMALFRNEVVENRANRLHGEIGLDVPMAWHVVGLTLLGSLVLGVTFLTLASYSQVVVVRGNIVMNRGVAPVLASRAGVVTAVVIREGQSVSAGTSLARIRTEENVAPSRAATDQVIQAFSEQDKELAREVLQRKSAAAGEQAKQRAQIDGLEKEIESIGQQIAVQQRLVGSARKELELVREVAERGFISHRDVLNREDTLLIRTQELAKLEESLTAKRAAADEARRSMQQAEADAAAEIASVSSKRADIKARRAETEASRGYVILAPVPGVVTALTARAGQSVTDQQPLMTIVPAGAVPRAELYVPTSAVGFLSPGQKMRLAIDAFPYERFGTISARIIEISSATIERTNASGAAEPVYLVNAQLEQPGITAFGRQHRLLAGMTLAARIVTKKESLLEWLFEPILAVNKR